MDDLGDENYLKRINPRWIHILRTYLPAAVGVLVRIDIGQGWTSFGIQGGIVSINASGQHSQLERTHRPFTANRLPSTGGDLGDLGDSVRPAARGGPSGQSSGRESIIKLRRLSLFHLIRTGLARLSRRRRGQTQRTVDFFTEHQGKTLVSDLRQRTLVLGRRTYVSGVRSLAGAASLDSALTPPGRLLVLARLLGDGRSRQLPKARQQAGRITGVRL